MSIQELCDATKIQKKTKTGSDHMKNHADPIDCVKVKV